MTSIEKTARNKPSVTAQFHCSDWDLQNRFPYWYEITHPSSPEEDFNVRYAREAEELNIEYSLKLVLDRFSPLINILNKIAQPLLNKKILELGGASGLLSFYLQSQKADRVTLLETQDNFVKKAKKRGVRDVRLCDAAQLDVLKPGEKFDIVIAHRVFEEPVMEEHKAKRLMTQVRNILTPKGCIIIGTGKGQILSDAIIRGSGLPLARSYEFPNNTYVNQVNVYKLPAT